MCMKLMYITNDAVLAKIAEDSGVDWIFVDLEINGKDERQSHLDSVISRHTIKDVKRINDTLSYSKLIVRINPIYEGTQLEIEQVIENGADIIMLPFFKTVEEVQTFLNIINGRIKTCLLLETKEAVDKLDNILDLDGIDYIHIGLNDLHLSYNMNFMFEPLSEGLVDKIIDKIKNKNIEYGFGGVASLGKGDLPAEYILNEHIRLQSSMVILSRSFYKSNYNDNPKHYFKNNIHEIRNYLNITSEKPIEFLQNERVKAYNKIQKISMEKGGRK